MQTPDEAADTLEAAADLIRINGLNKGDFWDDAHKGGDYVPDLAVCALGALGIALGCTKPGRVAQTACDSLATKSFQAKVGQLSITTWNDRPETTPELVVETFLATAKNLRNGQLPSEC